MKNRKQGAILVEVLVALFITAIVFIAVYTTITVSLTNTRYLQQARETSSFASQIAEAFEASAECEEYSCFDYIKTKYGRVSAETELNLDDIRTRFTLMKANGDSVVDFYDLIDTDKLTEYKVQLFLIAPNAVYQNENSIGKPFGTSVYSPDENLMTFELRVQKNSKDWGGSGYSIYKERQPAIISYIFQVNRGTS